MKTEIESYKEKVRNLEEKQNEGQTSTTQCRASKAGIK